MAPTVGEISDRRREIKALEDIAKALTRLADAADSWARNEARPFDVIEVPVDPEAYTHG